jgi:hypothetical protein
MQQESKVIMSRKEEKEFLLDIRRTIILGAYIYHWRLPDQRTISRRGGEVIEVYSFAPQADEKVHRFATVGISGIARQDKTPILHELFMCLPKGLAGASIDEVISFILDVAVYSLGRDTNFEIGATIPETPLMPQSWAPRAIILDEPRGESEELEYFHVGSQHINLIWLVPIYKAEYELIAREGLDAFYHLEEQSDWSLADPDRPSLTITH